LECLKWLHESGCPWDDRCIKYAAEHGNLDCIKYAHGRRSKNQLEEGPPSSNSRYSFFFFFFSYSPASSSDCVSIMYPVCNIATIYAHHQQHTRLARTKHPTARARRSVRYRERGAVRQGGATLYELSAVDP
jgi:hypothetical protein